MAVVLRVGMLVPWVLVTACGRIGYDPLAADVVSPDVTQADAFDAGLVDAPIDVPTVDVTRPDTVTLDVVDAATDAGSDAPTDAPSDTPVDSGAYEYHWAECESGTLVGAMTTGSDVAASGGAYAYVPTGPASWTWSSPGLPPSRVELPVVLQRPGTFAVWIRYYAISMSADAWYAGFSGVDMRRFYENTTYGAWVWQRGIPTDPMRLEFTGLTTGPHTLILGPGEAGPRCDRVLVTNDLGYVPAP